MGVVVSSGFVIGTNGPRVVAPVPMPETCEVCGLVSPFVFRGETDRMVCDECCTVEDLEGTPESAGGLAPHESDHESTPPRAHPRPSSAEPPRREPCLNVGSVQAAGHASEFVGPYVSRRNADGEVT